MAERRVSGRQASRARSSVQAPAAADVLAELTRLGKPNTANIYARHGVKERSVGLPSSALNALIKRLGTRHELVEPLWKSGIHDARVLAMKVADPSRVSAKELDSWLRQASNYIVTGAIAGLASRRPGAEKWALSAIGSKHEWTASAGWSVLTDLVLAGQLEAEVAAPLLEQIQKQIHTAPNRARYSMNNTLIAVGSKIASLRERAFQVADAIGQVEVDHGQTGCKTPSAKDYIEKVLAHDAKKTDAKKTDAKKTGAKKTDAKKTDAKKTGGSQRRRSNARGLKNPKKSATGATKRRAPAR